MAVENSVSLFDQGLIESALIGSGFISTQQQNGLAFGVESKGDAKLMMSKERAQFLEIGMT